jgi:hypothetical protein
MPGQPDSRGQDQASDGEPRRAQSGSPHRQFLEQSIRARVVGHVRRRSPQLGQGTRQLAPARPLARLRDCGVGNLGTKLGFELGRIVEKTAERRLLRQKPSLGSQLAQIGGQLTRIRVAIDRLGPQAAQNDALETWPDGSSDLGRAAEATLHDASDYAEGILAGKGQAPRGHLVEQDA